LSPVVTLDLADHEFDEVEDRLECLRVRVATDEHLFIDLVWQCLPRLVELLALLFHRFVVSGQVADERIDQLHLILQVGDKRGRQHLLKLFVDLLVLGVGLDALDDLSCHGD